MTRRLYKLALKMLIRDWRFGEFKVLLFALIVAVTCMTSINFFTNRVEKAIALQASEFIGGDFAVESPREIPVSWLEQAKNLGLNTAQTLVFMSMLTHEDNLQLASVKAVTEHYPLRGDLKISDDLSGTEKVIKTIPEANAIWLDQRLLTALNVKIGDTITLGAKQFTVTHILSYEPDRSGYISSFSPRALINWQAIAATQIVQPGSRLEYRLLTSGPEKAVSAFKNWLKPQLTESEKIYDLTSGRPELESVMTTSTQYLNLAALLSVLLAGVAIAISIKRYTNRHQMTVALLRSFGAIQKQIIWLFLINISLLGLVAITMGSILGYLAQFVLERIFASVLNFTLPASDATPILFGILSGFIVLYAFSLAQLLRLSHVPPLRVLRNLPLPTRIASMWVYIISGCLLGLVILWRTGDVKLASLLVAGFAITLFLIFILSFLLIKLANLFRSKVGVAWRYGLANLTRRWQSSVMQIIAFSFTIMAVLLLTVVRDNLLSTWQDRLPAGTPNYFVVNIAPAEVKAITALFKQNAIQTTQLYPIVRGRLVSLNDAPILNLSNEALRRELNLTWQNTIPKVNHENAISIGQKLAEDLGVRMGDKLSFRIGANTVSGIVTETRPIDWLSFKPNFYMIFSEHSLDDFPATYMGSFYLPKSKIAFLNQFIRDYPNVTVIDVDALLNQIRDLTGQVSYALQYLLFFTLAAGILVMIAAIQASEDERQYESKILRALGASRYQIITGLMAEFIALGFISGLIASIGAVAIAYALTSQLLLIEYRFDALTLVLGPAAGMAVTGLVGYFGIKFKAAPLMD